MMMGFGMFGWVLMLLVWVGLAAGAALLVKALFPSGATGEKQRELNARQMLELRYARGEITREELLRMKQDLEG